MLHSSIYWKNLINTFESGCFSIAEVKFIFSNIHIYKNICNPYKNYQLPELARNLQSSKKLDNAILKQDKKNIIDILSPISGIFYSSSKPGASPFVAVGSVVSKGQTLCIIEAMKTMNEIESDSIGKIHQICARNGDFVTKNQVLMKIILEQS
uniref:Biotin carboxyl carrier protein of acetyl-CoA carboxylase n=1 Tax=Cyanidium caldarium TaxID=2771 RepID=BCCP_CYACA|nr:acetyl-CoA carboxylase biotin carboxyl carrier protein [Cyanidium caldarium]O19918.1 RecName: Full=Biotin carboxyl carrier protein of acetyl-CoA carboxylase; Short=BCCP [Cyanidium caldarium]AAB82671.1 unknown [Cyanidium caldarium]WDB00217.1 acetyl-CoA carboxylase biotin carboxyl carrier protein [Cyanidium caldarium]